MSGTVILTGRRFVRLLSSVLSCALLFTLTAGSAWAAAVDPVCCFLSRSDSPILVTVQLLLPAEERTLASALQAWLSGPPADAPLFTPAPAGTRLLSATVRDGTATVDLSRELLRANVGSLGEALLVSSLTSTSAESTGAEQVQVLVAGQRVETLAGHIGARLPFEPEHSFDFRGFTDTNKHWAERTIDAMALRGIISGYDDDTFRPERTATRAEMIKLITAGSGSIASDLVADSFVDIGPGHTFAAWIETAVHRGILRPSDYRDANGLCRLRPDLPCSRREAALMLVRAAGAEDRAVALSGQATGWTDVSSQPAWAVGYLLAVAERDLMRGYPDGTFRPSAALTRAEAATLVARLIGCRPGLALTTAVNTVACGGDLFVAGACRTGVSLSLEIANSQGTVLASHALETRACLGGNSYYAALLLRDHLPAGAVLARVVARSGGAEIDAWQVTLSSG
jgi:hypothetical protein